MCSMPQLLSADRGQHCQRAVLVEGSRQRCQKAAKAVKGSGGQRRSEGSGGQRAAEGSGVW